MERKTDNRLIRQVNEDGKGLFIFYGGYRIRPHQSGQTRFDLGERVSMHIYHGKNYVHVFDKAENRETWRSNI